MQFLRDALLIYACSLGFIFNRLLVITGYTKMAYTSLYLTDNDYIYPIFIG